MSFDGQVDWKRMLIGPVWPLAIMGKPSAAPVVATAAVRARNLRREAASGFLDCSLLISVSFGKAMGCPGVFFFPAGIALVVFTASRASFFLLGPSGSRAPK